MSFFRNTVWIIKGLKEFTKSGYESRAKHFKPIEEDLNGRSFMITGANSGIGKAAAVALASLGGTVHLVCRSKERGEEALEEIKKLSNNDVFLHLLDMSKPADVSRFAQEFVASGKPLHVLVNNAGCMVNTRIYAADKLETNFATNVLATHILTSGLVPVLEKHEDPRVIIVSSGGMLVKKLDTDDLMHENMTKFDGTMVYAQNKRQQVVMTTRYAEQWPKIQFSSMHPGWADTPAVQTSMPDFHSRMKSRLRTPEQGADTVVWLAATAEAKSQPNGKFYLDRQIAPEHLPLARTHSSQADELTLMKKLDDLVSHYASSSC